MQQNHRFQHLLNDTLLSTATPDTAASGAFMVCPAVLMQGWMGPPWLLLATYQRAYECAQAVVRPSRLERLQEVLWN